MGWVTGWEDSWINRVMGSKDLGVFARLDSGWDLFEGCFFCRTTYLGKIFVWLKILAGE